MKYTDLCARIDALTTQARSNPHIVADPLEVEAIRAAAAIQHLLKANNELEAERSHWMNEARRTLTAGQDALERAEAAEARVAELEAERDAVAKAADGIGYICSGCGHLCKNPVRDMKRLVASGAISCCPERDMRPISYALQAAIRKGATP